MFGCFPEQVRNFHTRNKNPPAAVQVRADFKPENLGKWKYRQVVEWSRSLRKGVYLHVFRKTAHQHALSGEHIN